MFNSHSKFDSEEVALTISFYRKLYYIVHCAIKRFKIVFYACNKVHCYVPSLCKIIV